MTNRSFQLYDVVRALGDIPDSHVKAGTLGTIVAKYEESPNAYLIEFFDNEKVTIDVIAVVDPSLLELAWSVESQDWVRS